MKRGEIWSVSFDPSRGHEIRKTRPALILQKDIFVERSPLVVVVPISSRARKTGVLTIPVSKKTGLKRGGYVKVDHIKSLDKQRFARRLGRVSHEIMDKVAMGLRILLDI